MSINYLILANDPTTHIVVVRVQDGDWTQGANFRDEVFDLNLVIPGAIQTFALMGEEMDYGKMLAYLETKTLQYRIDNGLMMVTPPNWENTVHGRYAQMCDLTPREFMPAAPTPDPTPSEEEPA